MKNGARAWELAGAAVLAAALLAPAADTDLWWHLSAGLGILDTGVVPRAETLSWSLSGAPWTDFEWGAQAVLAAARLGAGMWGVWLLKALLLAAAGAGVLAAARAAALAAPGRALALALFGVGVLPRADARTELFSVALFAALLAGLERLRSEDWPVRRLRGAALACAAAFALWANLHAGFPVGLALLAAYVLPAARRERRWLALPAAAAAATLLNPYGPGLWGVLWSHARESDALRGLILEWGPLGLAKASHLGAWSVVAAAACATLLCAGRGRLPGLPELFALALAASTARHARLAGYSAAAAPLIVAAAARMVHGLWERARPRRGAAAFCAAAFVLSLAAARPWRLLRGPYDPSLVPYETASWLAERPALEALRLYNPWSWGGYLSLRLGVPVYQDGRYLFHGLLAEQKRAAASPEAWQAFLEGAGAELVLLENIGRMLPTTFTDKAGIEARVERPYYLSYMPRERWALVWFDDAALVFVRRDRLPAGVEDYRWLRPRDGAALELARGNGLVDEDALAAEERRRAAERSLLRAEP